MYTIRIWLFDELKQYRWCNNYQSNYWNLCLEQKNQARTKLDEILKEKKETKKEVLERFKGYEVVEKLFDYLNIFKIVHQKSTTLKDVVLQLIYQRIKNNKVFNIIWQQKKKK